MAHRQRRLTFIVVTEEAESASVEGSEVGARRIVRPKLSCDDAYEIGRSAHPHHRERSAPSARVARQSIEREFGDRTAHASGHACSPLGERVVRDAARSEPLGEGEPRINEAFGVLCAHMRPQRDPLRGFLANILP